MQEALFHFESLTVYQRSFSLSKIIYTRSQTWPKEHLFGITDQLRRAILSISLNIAEGSSRTTRDYCHFLSIARGSCFECVPLINLAFSLTLITESEQKKWRQELQEIAQMLSSLRTALLAKGKIQSKNTKLTNP